MCGMSTSVQATVRGRFSDAVAANPVGLALVVLAVAVMLGLRIDPRRVPPWAAGVALTGMWVFQLFRFSIL